MGFSFLLLTVNLFRHPTLIEHGLYLKLITNHNKLSTQYAGGMFTQATALLDWHIA